jgi:RNA polymerase sigma-70 factor (ECF subfamily)
MSGVLSDEELVAACRRDDTAAFETLVRRHQQAMLNIAFRIIGDYDEACEAVQDAFVAAYRGLASFRGTARFTTWLTAITVNQSRTSLARLTSRRRNEVVPPDPPRGRGESLPAADLPCSAPSALEQLEAREVQRQVRECIAALPLDSREVLVLRDLQECSYEEIGEVLKVREGTVKSRLFRAREAVKECLKRARGGL